MSYKEIKGIMSAFCAAASDPAFARAQGYELKAAAPAEPKPPGSFNNG